MQLKNIVQTLCAPFESEHAQKSDIKIAFVVAWILTFITVLLAWSCTPAFFPKPIAVMNELVVLIKTKGLLLELLRTTILALKGMCVASIVALLLAYLGKIFLLLRPLSTFLSVARFLPLYGFSAMILFATQTIDGYKMGLLLLGTVPFLVTSFNATLTSLETHWIELGYTLKQNKFEIFWHAVMRNSAHTILDGIRQNFAVAWLITILVEVLTRDGGGVGQMLYLFADRSGGELGYTRAFGTLLATLLVGFLINALITAANKWLFPYTNKEKK